MSSECELNDGIKSIKSAWRREHTARANLEKMLQQAESENDRLRELAVLQSVIFKHMSTCQATDCQVCPVGEECAESVHLEGVLGIDGKETSWLVQWRSEDAADVRTENAKLREAVATAIKVQAVLCGDADRTYCRKKCPLHRQESDDCLACDVIDVALELGIEV